MDSDVVCLSAELKLTKQSGRLREELDEHSKAVAVRFSRVDEAYRTFTTELVEECAASKQLCHQRAEDMNTQLQRGMQPIVYCGVCELPRHEQTVASAACRARGR